MNNERPVLVDLFSGCGGFGLGGELAGFHSAIAVDIDSTLQSSYQLNFPKTNVMVGDIKSMNSAGWKLLLNGLEVDGVIGGPPCQGYSRLGRSNPDDSRRKLLSEFFKSVNAIRPKFFVMENVEGLLDKKNVIELESAIANLDEIYTTLDPFVLDASEFGLPTKRRRVFIVGYNPDYVDKVSVEEFVKVKHSVTVREAIYDLPFPVKQSEKCMGFAWARYDKRLKQSAYAKYMRSAPPLGLGSQLAVEQSRKGFVSGNANTLHSPDVVKRYASILPGSTDPVSRAKRLEWGGLCPTLRAGTGSDKGSHQAVRPLHPDEARVITVREAARLQGFPDWFLLHKTKWHSFRMIGNSVPPLLASAILSVMRAKLINSQQSDKSELEMIGDIYGG